MIGEFYRLTASRFLWGRRSNALRGALIIVAVSAIPLSAAMQVSSAMSLGIMRRYLETSSYHIRAEPLFTPSSLEIERARLALLRVPGVIYAGVETENFGVAFTRSGRRGVLARGVPDSIYRDDPGLARYLTVRSGSFDLRSETDMLAGSRVARDLGLKVGDTMNLLYAGNENMAVPAGIARFTVRGIVDTGYRELDKTWVFVSDRAARDLFGLSAEKFSFGIKVKEPYHNIEAQTAAMAEAIGDNWLAFDWKALNKPQIDNLRSAEALLSFILGLIVLVAVAGSSGSLYAFFLDNRKEMAILQAMGAAGKRMERLFFFSGVLVGAVGAALGLALGVIISVNINGLFALARQVSTLFGAGSGIDYYLDDIPVKIGPWRLLAAWTLITGVCALSGWIPARRAARSKPIDALRKN